MAHVVSMACLLLPSLYASGCVTASHALTGAESTQTRSGLIDAMDHRYPGAFKSIHRAALTVRGRQFILDGFIRVNDEEYRTVAANGFGTTLFEIRGDEAGSGSVTRHDPSLDPDVLLAGPAHDIHAIYFSRPAESDALVRFRDDAYAIVGERADGTRVEYVFDPLTHHCMSITERRKVRLVRRIFFDEYTDVSDTGFSHPQRIRIENPRGRYRVDIRVASVTPDRPGV